MIIYKKGDLFESGANIFVCPVNCEGKFEQPIQKLFEENMQQEVDIYKLYVHEAELSGHEIDPDLYLAKVNKHLVCFPTRYYADDQVSGKMMVDGYVDLFVILSDYYKKHLEYIHVAMPLLGSEEKHWPIEDCKKAVKHYLQQLGDNVLIEIYE